MIDETKIMQYADGTLPIEEREEVQKAIEADPKLKELYNTFKETGDLLFKLSNEVKSKPLPQNLQEKAEILKSWNKPVIKDKDKSFNFFGLFKFQYAGVAAAFCLFFVGGFYTNTFMASLDDRSTGTVKLSKKIEVEPEKLKMRSIQKDDEDLQTRIANLYRYFDEEAFIAEMNNRIEEIAINEEFETTLTDNLGKPVKFILVKKSEINDYLCKTVEFNELVRLSGIDKGTKISLDLCKKNEGYELTSINILKN